MLKLRPAEAEVADSGRCRGLGEWRSVMAPEIISQIASGLGRNLPSDLDQIGRAATALVKAHRGNALRVAMRLAENAELSGSRSVAYTWRQIAKAVRRWNGPAQEERRNDALP